MPDWVWDPLAHHAAPRSPDQAPYYAKIGVRHHWLVDLDARTGTAYALHGEQWLELGTWSDEHDARMPPFDAVAIDVSRWWA